MLTNLHKIGGLEEAIYYAEQAIAKAEQKHLSKEKVVGLVFGEYLMEGAGTTSFVSGDPELMKTLGLKNGDTVEEIKNAMAATDTNGQPLLKDQGEGREHCPGYSLLISDGKELSIIRGLAGDSSAYAIDYDDSIKKALESVLREASKLIDSKNQRRAGEKIEVAWLAYRHADARPGEEGADMNLHYHITLPNVGRYEDGSYGAIETGRFFEAARTQWLGQLLQSEVVRLMRGKGYGLDLEERVIDNGKEYPEGLAPTYKQAVVNGGLTPEQIKKFSQRTVAIDAKLELYGIENAGVKEKTAASLATRKGKIEMGYDELKGQWLERAEAYGIERITDRSLKEKNQNFATEQNSGAMAQAKTELEKEIQRLKALVFKGDQEFLTEGNIKNAHAKAYAGLCSIDKIIEMSQAYLSHELSKGQQWLNDQDKAFPVGVAAISIGEGFGKGVAYVPSQCLLREKEFETNANELAGDLSNRFDLDPDYIEIVKFDYQRTQGFKLSDEQMGAILSMTNGRLSIVEGVAGAGKSTIAEVASLAYKNKGYQVIGLAPTSSAAKALEPSLQGGKAYTIDKFLMLSKELDKVNEKTVFIVDEAGMASIPKLAAVLELAKAKGAKVIAMGDEAQLSSIGNKGGLGVMKEAAGSYAFLKENRRQERALVAGKEIGGLLRKGQSAPVLKMLEKQKALVVASDQKDIYKLAAEAYIDSKQNGSEKAVLLETNVGCDTVNAGIRKARLEAGELGDKFKASVKRKDEAAKPKEFYVRERIVFLENSKGKNNPFRWVSKDGETSARAASVENSLRGEITGFRLDTDGNAIIRAEIKDGKKMREIEWNSKDYQSWQLGAALTKHKSQGATLEDVIVCAEGSKVENRSTEYVGMTRHKNIAKLIGTAQTLAKWEINVNRKPDNKTLWQKLEDLTHRTPDIRKAVKLEGTRAVEKVAAKREDARLEEMLVKTNKAQAATVEAVKENKATIKAAAPAIQKQAVSAAAALKDELRKLEQSVAIKAQQKARSAERSR